MEQVLLELPSAHSSIIMEYSTLSRVIRRGSSIVDERISISRNKNFSRSRISKIKLEPFLMLWYELMYSLEYRLHELSQKIWYVLWRVTLSYLQWRILFQRSCQSWPEQLEPVLSERDDLIIRIR